MNTQPRIGRKFGRLTVSERFGPATPRRYTCNCDCGKSVVEYWTNLVQNRRKSCGCLMAEIIATAAATKANKNYRARSGDKATKIFILRKNAGATAHPLYSTWRAMNRRCHDVNFHKYALYGARGISVCSEWRESFWAFIEHVGEKPSAKHSIDRIDNDGNYEPKNVRWATASEQNANQRKRSVQLDNVVE